MYVIFHQINNFESLILDGGKLKFTGGTRKRQ